MLMLHAHSSKEYNWKHNTQMFHILLHNKTKATLQKKKKNSGIGFLIEFKMDG